MQKVKIFKSIESELEPMEAEINAWLKESGARVLSMTGNISPQSVGAGPSNTFSASDVLLIVLYEET